MAPQQKNSSRAFVWTHLRDFIQELKKYNQNAAQHNKNIAISRPTM